MDPIPDLCQPATLLSGHHSRRLFKGEWLGYPLAPDAGIGHCGHSHDPFEFSPIPEEAEIGWVTEYWKNGILELWVFEIGIVFHQSISSVLFHIIPSFQHSIFPEDWATGGISCSRSS
jgi:hypothetical protein